MIQYGTLRGSEAPTFFSLPTLVAKENLSKTPFPRLTPAQMTPLFWNSNSPEFLLADLATFSFVTEDKRRQSTVPKTLTTSPLFLKRVEYAALSGID